MKRLCMLFTIAFFGLAISGCAGSKPMDAMNDETEMMNTSMQDDAHNGAMAGETAMDSMAPEIESTEKKMK